MPDFSNFRLSDDIEDRRRIPFVPTPGPFGNGIDIGNVFDNGLLTNLSPTRDFVQTGPTPLGTALGLGSLDTPSNLSSPIFYKPQGALGDSIRAAESGGDPNAQNPNSSASGPDQFLDRTWLDTIKIARPDLANQPDDALLTLKTNPEISGQVRDAYAAQNQAILSKNGLPVTDGNTYLAHFAGPGGAVKILQSDPSASAASILGPAVVKANPFLANMTAADLQAWASKKMGGSAPQPQAPQASPAAPPGAPLNIAPLAPPIFAPQPQQPQQQQQSGAGGGFEQIPPMQAAPIFYAQRRSPDLSKLRAAFQAPIFPRG